MFGLTKQAVSEILSKIAKNGEILQEFNPPIKCPNVKRTPEFRAFFCVWWQVGYTLRAAGNLF